jgi:hypothetical protein
MVSPVVARWEPLGAVGGSDVSTIAEKVTLASMWALALVSLARCDDVRAEISPASHKVGTFLHFVCNVGEDSEALQLKPEKNSPS